MSRVKRYQNPEVYEPLAAEYVLGTLTGKARSRFERLIDERPYIRYAVEMWEGKLNPMAELVPEVAPPPRVWKAISANLGSTAGEGIRSASKTSAGWMAFFRGPGFWQAATAILVVTLGIRTLIPLVEDAAPMPALSYISVLQGEEEKPMVVTMGDMKRRVVSVRLVETPRMEGERVLELWAIKSPESKPVRIGVIPPDRKQTYLKLSEHEWKRMEGAKQFAITFEPRNRKNFDLPSGPVMYKGKCIDFI